MKSVLFSFLYQMQGRRARVPWTCAKMMRGRDRATFPQRKMHGSEHIAYTLKAMRQRGWAEQEFKEKQDELKRQAEKSRRKVGMKSFNV